MKAVRQLYRMINMLRCKKEISLVWMYSEVGECDNALPMSRLRVVQPSTCITRPSLGVHIGYAWWEAQLVLRPDVPCLQAISWAGGPGLCIVRMPDALFLIRVASEGFLSDTIASCAWHPGQKPGHPIHRCSPSDGYSDRGQIEWSENIVRRIGPPITMAPHCVIEQRKSSSTVRLGRLAT